MSPILESLCTHCVHGLAMGLTPLCVTYISLYLFSLSIYLIASVTLDISHFNINLLSAPASLKQYFIKHVLTKSSHVFAVNTPTRICSPTSSEFHKHGYGTPVTAQGPLWWYISLLLHAQYVTRSHVLSFLLFFPRCPWRLGKTIHAEQHKPSPLLVYFSFQLAPSVLKLKTRVSPDESANVKVKQKTL